MDSRDELSSLGKEFEELEGGRTNVFRTVGIESRERRLTRFLGWLLNEDGSHGAGDVFLDEFLTVCDIEEVEVLSVEEFCTVEDDKLKKWSGDRKAEIDLVLIGKSTCVGIEIKVNRQAIKNDWDEENKNLRKEEDALKLDFPYRDKHELVYLIFAHDDMPLPEFRQNTVFWSDLIQRFELNLDAIAGGYERRVTKDFISTIRTHVMSEFNGLSEQTRLYIEHVEAIDTIKEEYYDKDRDAILDDLCSRFFSADGIDDSWERNEDKDEWYTRLYKEKWHGLENNVNMEFEPHAKLRNSLTGKDAIDGPHILVRFDVERGKKEERRKVRSELCELLSEDEKEELDSDFHIFDNGEHSNKFISKPVPLSKDSEEYDPIEAANETIHRLRDIIEEPADEVADEY